MTFAVSIGANDLANNPQGSALALILQELRLLSTLTYMNNRGIVAEQPLEFMRAEEAIDSVVKFSTTATN